MHAFFHAGFSARLGVALAAALTTIAAQADSVMLTGTVGSRAILIINGSAPRTLAPGETREGVRLISAQGDQAVIEIAGQRSTLHMDSPVSVGSGGSSGGGGGTRIVLPVGSGGHFFTPGAINGKTVSFMLDTGATMVALSAGDAQRIGLEYTKGRPIQTNTANGVARGYQIKLSSVRVGDVELYDIDAIVSDAPMPYILLGNSFIGRFSMRRDADQLVLEKRY